MHLYEYLELDKKRVKHLASTIQELLLTEMKYDEEKYEMNLFISSINFFY